MQINTYYLLLDKKGGGRRNRSPPPKEKELRLPALTPINKIENREIS